MHISTYIHIGLKFYLVYLSVFYHVELMLPLTLMLALLFLSF